jgi:ribonuclease HII|tara:strand:- start:2137 stop:2733 length:597 start_codon:yes stop_codon:yes gene_type:complete
MVLKRYSNTTEVGCDEAGRGCLAGPVVASAVILPKGLIIEGLNDSKKLTSNKREYLSKLIKESALAWGIGTVSSKEIDKINILNASFLAMHRALDKLNKDFKLILVDGPYFNKYKTKNHICIIKGDGKIDSIAAASIIAKDHRDKLMISLGDRFKEYKWQKNKGYPTREHREALKKHGTTNFHRKSFKLLENQMKINL